MKRNMFMVVAIAAMVIPMSALAQQPVKINKTKTENKDQHWASDLCAVTHIPPGPIYGPLPIEKCHRGNPEIEQVKFQVALPRPVTLYLSGYLTASTKRGLPHPLAGDPAR